MNLETGFSVVLAVYGFTFIIRCSRVFKALDFFELWLLLLVVCVCLKRVLDGEAIVL